MPAAGRNTKPLSAFPEGYVLPSGKILTQEDMKYIGREIAKLPLRGDHDDLQEKKFECSETGDTWWADCNPVYDIYIDENPPLPPMLQFVSSSILTQDGMPNLKSYYTLNLRTLQPTRNSPIQTSLPEDFVNNLQKKKE